MATSTELRSVFSAGRPLVEQWLDIGEQMAALRDAATAKGLDWSQVKALLKAQIQDERDETGNGKRVQKIVDKAEHASAYADMLGLAKMNENNFSPEDPTTQNYQDRFFPHSSAPTSSPETTDSPAPDSLQASGNHLSQIAASNTDHAQTDDAVQSGDESTAPLSDDVPAFLLKDRQPLRPLCQNPTECAGYGTKTCHRCLTAAGRSEVAA